MSRSKASPDDELNKLRTKVLELEARLAERRRYGLVWEEPTGEADDPYETEKVRDRSERELPLLKEEPTLAIGQEATPHILIEGDNYYTLSGLTFTHHRAIDVIYIDPPYNTGRKDFIYNDRFVKEDDAYRHSKWLSFMAPRLTLASELLRDEGVIIVSIDDSEFAHLKLLMDEIFGESNFIGNIIRATNSTKSNSNFLSINYDYALLYAKDKTKLEALIKQTGRKWEVEKNNREAFEKKAKSLMKKGLGEEELTSELKELVKYPRFIDMTNYHFVDKRGVYRTGDLGGVKNGNKKAIKNPKTGKLDPVPKSGFRFSPEALEKLIEDDRIHFYTDGKTLPGIKRYLSENPRSRPRGIMSDDQRPDANLLSGMGLEFDNPKQLAFMKRVLSIFGPNAVVLDFFAGSATTGHAILELNALDGGARQVILATDDQRGICREVAYKRLEKAITGYKAKRRNKTEEVAGLGGALLFFTSGKEFIKRSETPDQMRVAFRTACRDLLRLRENCFEPVNRGKLFEIFTGEDRDGSRQALAILYGLEGREKLIEELEKQPKEALITVYAFSLNSPADPKPFRQAFSDRLRLGSIPEQLLRTYERAFERRLYGGWSA